MLTRNGWWFVALGVACLVAGVALSYRELVMVALAFLGCLVAAAVSMVLRPDLEVTRTVSPHRVDEGERASGILTVTNVGRRRSAPVQATETLGKSAITVSLPSLAAGATHTATYRLPTDRRGCYTVGPLQIGRSDPLHLSGPPRPTTPRRPCGYCPASTPPAPSRRDVRRNWKGRRTTRRRAAESPFTVCASTSPGDDPRLIHWKSTARTGTLMVRHTVITNEPRLLIVLDTSRAALRRRVVRGRRAGGGVAGGGRGREAISRPISARPAAWPAASTRPGSG